MWFQFQKHPQYHCRPRHIWNRELFLVLTSSANWSSKTHVKYIFPLNFIDLIFYLDPSQILHTENYWNSFQSFQFQFSARPPALARAGDMFWRKLPLKNFYDPKTAGGCGVAPFSSWKDLFCHAQAQPAQHCAHDLFQVSRCVVLACECVRLRSGGCMAGIKKPALRGLSFTAWATGQWLANTWY